MGAIQGLGRARLRTPGWEILQDTQWSRFLFDLTTPISTSEGGIGRRQQSATLKPPVEIISFSVRSRFHEGAGGAAFFGRVEAETPGGVTTIHDFSSADGWHVIEDFRKPGLYSLGSQPIRRCRGVRRNQPVQLGLRGHWADRHPGRVSGRTASRVGQLRISGSYRLRSGRYHHPGAVPPMPCCWKWPPR